VGKNLEQDQAEADGWHEKSMDDLSHLLICRWLRFVLRYCMDKNNELLEWLGDAR
jgi:hypothetical protein